MITEAEIVTEL